MFGKKKKKEEVKEEDLGQVKGSAEINIAQPPPSPCLICVKDNDKPFLTVHPDGRMEFNKNDYPEWRTDNFAREFVNCVETITGFKSGK